MTDVAVAESTETETTTEVTDVPKKRRGKQPYTVAKKIEVLTAKIAGLNQDLEALKAQL